MYRKIFPIMEPGDRLLTPNRRLASRLRQAFDDLHKDQTCWHSPSILSLDDWLVEQWGHAPDAYLLTKHEELLVWQQTIETDKETQSAASTLAPLTMNAWALLHNANLSVSDLEAFLDNDDVRAFHRWATLFQQQLTEKQLLTKAELASQLQTRIKTHIHKATLYLYGFDSLPPSQQQLLNAYDKEYTIKTLNPGNQNKSSHRALAATPEEELKQMAIWAYSKHLKTPAACIACVIPNLSEQREHVVSLFNDTFKDKSNALNISSGTPLANTTMVATALAILAINKGDISYETSSQLLTSSYLFSDATSACMAAHLDRNLRSQNQKAYPLDQIQAQAAALCPVYNNKNIVSAIKDFAQIKSEHKIQRHSAWATFFVAQLSAIGWPGNRGFTSIEHQIHSHWNDTLIQFCALENIFAPVNQSTAILQLKQLCQNHLFQEKTDDAPVQVLGLLEAAGDHYDALWIMEMDDEHFPPRAHANPLLPLTLARKHDMPHSSASREFKYAEDILAQLIALNTEFIASSSMADGDKTLAPSPLILSLPLMKTIITPNRMQNETSLVLEYCDDHTAPAINADEKVYGGSWMLNQQANCPFMAFAKTRLRANSLEQPLPGISALEKGSLVHSVLEIVWKTFKTQQALLDCDKEQCETLITEAINESMRTMPGSLHTNTEKKRIQHIITQWLDIERARPPFRVSATEVSYHIEYKTLSFNVRIDRIDDVAGEPLIIDYKTGLSSISGWFDERLTALQLPLYATQTESHCQGISFAQIKRGKLILSGVSATDLGIKGIVPIEKVKYSNHSVWASQKDEWRQSIEHIADAFLAGDASVDPAPTSMPCNVCDLAPLCRIDAND